MRYNVCDSNGQFLVTSWPEAAAALKCSIEEQLQTECLASLGAAATVFNFFKYNFLYVSLKTSL